MNINIDQYHCKFYIMVLKLNSVIIRIGTLLERKGRYYVYNLETINGEIKETYVCPLVNVVETYIKLKDNSIGGNKEYSPTMGPAGFEPATTRAQALRPSPG